MRTDERRDLQTAHNVQHNLQHTMYRYCSINHVKAAAAAAHRDGERAQRRRATSVCMRARTGAPNARQSERVQTSPLALVVNGWKCARIEKKCSLIKSELLRRPISPQSSSSPPCVCVRVLGENTRAAAPVLVRAGLLAALRCVCSALAIALGFALSHCVCVRVVTRLVCWQVTLPTFELL